jgi:hypothetical protein
MSDQSPFKYDLGEYVPDAYIGYIGENGHILPGVNPDPSTRPFLVIEVSNTQFNRHAKYELFRGCKDPSGKLPNLPDAESL